MARRSSRQAMCDHIVRVAANLFYSEGIYVVGVDRIALKADITKRTLYRYFRTKDQLIAAALRYDYGLHFPRDGTALERIVGAFKAMGEFLVLNDFRGCPYINAVAELVDRRHPARAVILEETARRRKWFYARAKEAGIADADLLADQLEALFDGALAGAAKRGSLTPVNAAGAAAETLFTSLIVAGSATVPPAGAAGAQHARTSTQKVAS